MKLFEKRCTHRHTKNEHPNCFLPNGEPKTQEELEQTVKILSLDIETLPIVAYSWGVWKQNIYDTQIIKDWCLLSYSAKWVGSSSIISNVLSSKEAVTRDDKKLSNELWMLLDEADIINGHNSRRFDIKKINARFWKYNLHRPSSYKHIDTLTVARSMFGLTYNKLDFIAEYKNIQEKLETDFELWRQCDEGNKSALQRMREYNERDVEIQEQIYFEMRDWIPNHPNLTLYVNKDNACPVCLAEGSKEIGIYVASIRKYPEYRCSQCGSVWHSTKSVAR